MKIMQHNVETGVIRELEATQAQIQAMENAKIEFDAKLAERIARIEAKKAALSKLGLTQEEIAAILL